MSAQRHEIINEVLALSQHYSRVVRTPQQEETFLRDYLEDLADYPISAIKAGCKAWRNSEATRFPTPGQLVSRVRANLPQRAAAHNEPWREISDGDYASLSLSEKVRHHLIAAADCRRKAGPMWGMGAPKTEAECGPVRKRWVEMARNHEREAQRLRVKLNNAEGKTAPFRPEDIPAMLGPKPSTTYPKPPRAEIPPYHPPVDETGLSREMRELMGIPDADEAEDGDRWSA